MDEPTELQRQAYRLRQLAPVRTAIDRYQQAVERLPASEAEDAWHEALDAMRTVLAGLG